MGLLDPSHEELGQGHGQRYGQGDERRVLRIHGIGGIEVRDARSYLEALERAYNGALLFEILLTERVRLSSDIPTFWIPGTDPIQSPVPESEALVLAQVRLESPGFWAVLGGLNPLETIRNYLNDRHERNKDRDYRNPLERQKLEAELEAARLENLSKRIKIFRDLDVPVDQIAEELLNRPLRELGSKQDDGVITTAEWAEVE
jgi:hypothetical protein